MNWAQLKTVLWLRWRLTQNQWARGGNWGAVVAALVVTVIAMAVLLLFSGSMAAGILAFRTAPPFKLLLTWDVIISVFLIAWMVGLLTELQRSETIDLQRLMHLPVSLGQIFVVNYVASHLVFSIILVTPVMAGLSIGLAIARGPEFLLLLPLAFSVVFMVTAWTYCLRGWFAALMSNPRRRRSAVVIISMVVVLISQLPNIYFNVWNRQWQRSQRSQRDPAKAKERAEARRAREQQAFESWAAAHKYVPPLWLPLGARTLAEQTAWPSLLGTAGCLLIGGAGLRRAYAATVRFYRGETGKKAAVPPRAARLPNVEATGPPKRLLVEKSIRGLPEVANAVAFATLRSMMRAPEVKMQWSMAVMMTVVFGFMFLLRDSSRMPSGLKPFAVTGLITMSLFMLVQVMANQFGFDRAGFRALVLSPARRRDVLLGKNLAHAPAPVFIALAVTTVCAVWLKMSAANALLVLLQFGTMFVLVSLLGNLLSILVPYRIRAGSMKPTKLPAKAQFVMFVTHMMFPAIMAPAFLPAGVQFAWDYFKAPPFPIGLALATMMFLTALAAYWLALQPTADLLTRREMTILDRIGTEVE